MRLTPVNMEFLYGTSFSSPSPEAYEPPILDAMRGDATLFARDDEVEAQWRIIDPVLEVWESSAEAPTPYPAGSAGPAESTASCCPATAGARSDPDARGAPRLRRGPHRPARARRSRAVLAHPVERALLDLPDALGAQPEDDRQLAQRPRGASPTP